MTNYEYRASARESLKGQWGMNAGIIFLSMIVSGAISSIVFSVAPFQSDSIQATILSFLLNIVILFAFEYAQYYIALAVARGKRAEVGDLFVIFQGKYYVPMAIFNLVSTILQTLFGLIIFLPVFLVAGVGAYLTFVTGAADRIVQMSSAFSAVSLGVAALVVIATVLIFALITAIVSGIFQFAAWAKMDNPQLATTKALSQGWVLIKDRMGQYILLQLSFIGWYILGAIFFGIGLSLIHI